MISYKIILIAAVIGMLPVIGWFGFIAKKNKLGLNGANWLLKIFFWGVLSAIPASFLEIWLTETGSDSQLATLLEDLWTTGGGGILSLSLLVTTVLMASMEELSKGFWIALAIFKDKIRTVRLGMLAGMVVGLAFGVTENGVYFASNFNSAELVSLIYLRFILSTSAHVIYSGLLGAFLVSSNRRWLNIMLAITVPIIIHTGFNILVGTSLMFLTPVLILFGFGLLWFQYVLEKKKVLASKGR